MRSEAFSQRVPRGGNDPGRNTHSIGIPFAMVLILLDIAAMHWLHIPVLAMLSHAWTYFFAVYLSGVVFHEWRGHRANFWSAIGLHAAWAKGSRVSSYMRGASITAKAGAIMAIASGFPLLLIHARGFGLAASPYISPARGV